MGAPVVEAAEGPLSHGTSDVPSGFICDASAWISAISRRRLTTASVQALIGGFSENLVHAFLGNGVPILSVRDWRRRRPRCLFGSRHSRPLFSRTYAHRPPHRRRAAAAPRSFFESLTACSGSASQAPPSEATAAASLPAPGQAARGASTLPSLAPATEGAAARDVGVDLVLDGFAVDGLAATLAIRGGANTFACLLTYPITLPAGIAEFTPPPTAPRRA